MKRILLLSIFIFFSLSSICSFSAPVPKKYYRHRTRIPRRRAYRRKKSHKYHYIKKHDINNDGTVNYKDKVLWLKKHHKTTTSIVIEAPAGTDEETLLEEFDINEDGQLDIYEIEVAFESYDINEDGVLDEKDFDD